MPKLLKSTLIALGALLALVLAVVAVIVATFDPNDHKALLVEQVQSRYQRTLAIPGRIELSLFPRLGVRLGAVSLSEPRSADSFATLRSARISLALLPLLRRQLVVDHIQVDGLQARLTRLADGRTSIDDLLGTPGTAPAAPAAPASAAVGGMLQFDIAGIAIDDAAFTVDDRQAGRRLVLSKAALRSGRIAPGVPADASVKGHLVADTPVLDAELALKGSVSFETAPLRVAVKDLKLEFAGRAATLSGLKASLSAATLTASAQAVGMPQLALEASVDGRLLKAGGSAQIDLARQRLDTALTGQFDQSRFKAQLGLASFTPAAWRFDVEVDQIDVDRYLGTAPATATTPATAPAAPEKPLDLSALRTLNASGSLRVGTLQVAQLKTQKLRLDLRAAGGRVDMHPLSAELYEGRLAGSAALVASAVPRIVLKQTLSGISVGPLVKDATGKATLEGRGDVVLDVTSQGTTVGALKKALAGSARLELRDGMVRGFNIAQTLRSARARLGEGSGRHTGTGTQAEATDFSALTASFRVDNGVAHNDDLQASSPLLRVNGSGDVDLGNSRLDYLVKATVVATLEGQGGPELQALRGQTVPVRLQGPFNAIGYQIDFAGMAKDLAKQKLEGKTDAAKAKAKERLGDKLKELFGK